MNQHIKRAFNQAATSYDANAHLQQSTGETLLRLLSTYPLSSPRIIDLGCGTGRITEKLAATFQYSDCHAIDFANESLTIAAQRLQHTKIKIYPANFDNLPAHTDHFDLIFSNMALHWSADFKKLLQLLQFQLNNNGLIAFSIPLATTLKELQPHFRVNTFMRADDILNQLRKYGYTLLMHHTETMTQYFNDTLSALKSIKQVGANAPTQFKAPNTFGKTKLTSILIETLTYHIGYFIAKIENNCSPVIASRAFCGEAIQP